MEEKRVRGWEGISLSNPTKEQFRSVSKDLDSRWKKLLARPRVHKSSDMPPQQEGIQARGLDFDKVGIETFIAFLEDLPPNEAGWNHGHMNEAVFYILKGKGYELHDGKKYEWEAGDVVIIPNGCAHSHVNPDPKEAAQAIVINPKRTFVAMNLLAQRLIELPEEVKRQD